ncbi:MAG: tripartite tricarboxylate transporter substrate binding protein [Alphaproteobacteria bacterium]|nr:tripartite tricarboxylate transporter substrate binding protein [Alphaproteobacteria bacterium]
MTLFRAAGLAAILVPALVLGSAGAATAADFPTRPITLIVPWPAGGSADIQLRVLASAASKHLPQPIVIENKPGGTGVVGVAQMIAAAKPDGYTISQIAISVMRIPWTQKVTYNPTTDLSYIIHLSGFLLGVVVKGDAPWQTWQDLAAWSRANPQMLTYGTVGAGSTHHITMEQIARRLGLTVTHVPFKGDAELFPNVIGGHVVAGVGTTSAGALVDAGELRWLVTFGAEPSKRWPAVPTLRQVGIDMAAESPYGLAGPKGMPGAVVKVLHDALKKALFEPEHLAILDQLNQPVVYKSSRDYTLYAHKLYEDAGEELQALGLRKTDGAPRS